MDIPAHARSAQKGLLQKRREEDLHWIVPHVPLMTRSVKGLNWTELKLYIWVNKQAGKPASSQPSNQLKKNSQWKCNLWRPSWIRLRLLFGSSGIGDLPHGMWLWHNGRWHQHLFSCTPGSQVWLVGLERQFVNMYLMQTPVFGNSGVSDLPRGTWQWHNGRSQQHHFSCTPGSQVWQVGQERQSVNVYLTQTPVFGNSGVSDLPRGTWLWHNGGRQQHLSSSTSGSQVWQVGLPAIPGAARDSSGCCSVRRPHACPCGELCPLYHDYFVYCFLFIGWDSKHQLSENAANCPHWAFFFSFYL